MIGRLGYVYMGPIPNGFSPKIGLDRPGLLFTQDHFGTGTEQIQNWTYFSVGPILDLFGSIPDQF